MTTPPRILLSRFDQERLERLLDKVGPRPDMDALREEIERAEIVEPQDVPSTLVTMNSTVRFRDEISGEESEVTLVFPAHADTGKGRVSVLAPIGSALLGLSMGDEIDWALPEGRTKRLRVIGISYQPEAAGDTHL